MKKSLTVLLSFILLIPGLMLQAQNKEIVTSIEEDFEDGLISERWQPEDTLIYVLTNVDDAGNKVLQIEADKNNDNSTGFTAIRYHMGDTSVLDLSSNPYVSLRVKANEDVPLQFNLWTETNGNINETAITYNIAGNEQWVDLLFDFNSVMSETDTVDESTVITLLINFNPGYLYTYQGTVWFDDFKVGEAAAPPAGTWFADYFNYDVVDTTIYQRDANHSHVFSIDEGALKVAVNKVANWDGFVVKFPDTLDMSNHPLASMKIRTEQNLVFRIYVWDIDSLYEQSYIDYTISPSAEFHTYYFDWTGNFWDGAWNDDPEDYVPLDSTQITLLLINIQPGSSGDFGNVWIDDLRVGSVAEIQTLSNDKDILATDIGVISGTTLKNIPEGTTAGELLSALTLSPKATAKVLTSSGGSQAPSSEELTNSHVVEVTAENGTKKEYAIELLVIPEDALRIYKLPGTVEMPTFLDVENGQIDDNWALYPAVDLDHLVADLDEVGATHDGPSDLSGTFKTVWNEYALYILVEINDDVLMNNSTNTYADDAVELFLDMTNKKNDVNTGYGSDDYQIMFGYNETNAEVFIGGGATGHVFGWEQGLHDGGYWMEIELDMEALMEPTGLNAEVGHIMGLDIQIDDDDGNFDNDGDGTRREHILLWNAEANENWRDPSGFGTAVLAGDLLDIENRKMIETQHTLYPNPAANEVVITHTGNVQQIDIYSLTGSRLRTIPGNFAQNTSLDLSSYESGVYLIKLTAEDGTTDILRLIKK